VGDAVAVGAQRHEVRDRVQLVPGPELRDGHDVVDMDEVLADFPVADLK